jgi:hypothetical protein
MTTQALTELAKPSVETILVTEREPLRMSQHTPIRCRLLGHKEVPGRPYFDDVANQYAACTRCTRWRCSHAVRVFFHPRFNKSVR